MRHPNRTPLLISGVLVALTAVPTMVVVAAGSATLDRPGQARTPTVDGLSDSPVIVEPNASRDLREEPSPDHESVLAMPVTRPPRGERTPERSGGGVGGGSSMGTGKRPQTGTTPVPESDCPSTAPPPPAPPVQPTQPTQPPSGGRIDDNAWPGWDRGMTPSPESAPAPRRHKEKAHTRKVRDRKVQERTARDRKSHDRKPHDRKPHDQKDRDRRERTATG